MASCLSPSFFAEFALKYAIDSLTSSKNFVSTGNDLGIAGINYSIEYKYNEASGDGKLFVNYWEFLTETGGSVGVTVNFFRL